MKKICALLLLVLVGCGTRSPGLAPHEKAIDEGAPPVKLDPIYLLDTPDGPQAPIPGPSFQERREVAALLRRMDPDRFREMTDLELWEYFEDELR